MTIIEEPLEKILLIILTLKYRNSRTGNARRAVSQPDHDILEGLPIRRWHKTAVNVTATTLEKADANTVPLQPNGYPELEMPRDWNMLSETCQAILLSARRGMTLGEENNEAKESAERGDGEVAHKEEKPGLMARKWALFSKDFEPKEPEFLAKRRKGLRSLYGGSTAPMNIDSQMRKIKIRNIDSEGNSQIVEALVPEGQAVDAEVVDEDLTTPTRALTPGTTVEGLGIANAEGVLVPVGEAIPASQRKRPPPPKRRLKGPGRGKKKKVAFTPGADSSNAPGNRGAVDGNGQRIGIDIAIGTRPGEGGDRGEDSIMQDVGPDGEEGSEDGTEEEEGEEGAREGDLSPTPEVEEISNGQVPLAPKDVAEAPGDARLPRAPPSPTGDLVSGKATFVEAAPLLEEGAMLIKADLYTEVPNIKSPTTTNRTSSGQSESGWMNDRPGATEIVIRATPASGPPPATEESTTLAEENSAPCPPRGDTKELKPSKISVPLFQGSRDVSDEQHVPSHNTRLPVQSPHLPPKSLIPLLSNSTLTIHNPIAPPSTSQADYLDQTPSGHSEKCPHGVASDSTQPEGRLSTTCSSPPPQSLEVLAVPEPPKQEDEVSSHMAPASAMVTSELAPAFSAPMTQDRYEVEQPLLEAESSFKEHRYTPTAPTPEAPTPSPPTPIAMSFDAHQRQRLMESPKSPNNVAAHTSKRYVEIAGLGSSRPRATSTSCA